MTIEEAVALVRPHCLSLPGAEETVKWGNDIVFQLNGKMFAIVGEWRGDLCLTVKVGKQAMGVFLEDPRYFEAPYVGKHGWVSLKLASGVEAEEISELARGSYELVKGSKRRSRPGPAER
jgi:predicted DNA-binding protein (MmcQ/YjbR family)